MGKKILLAVGDCVYSKHAVKYAATVCSAVRDLTYTLFNVHPGVPSILYEGAEDDAEVNAEINALVRENDEAAKCVVGELKDLAVEQGVPHNRIEMATEPMKAGMAKDILDRGQEGRYDAILLARRGLTPNKDFFIGTTAGKIVDHGLQIPVWVVDGELSPLNVMIAVDGSARSADLVDYVLKMVGANPELELTLFHVVPYLRHYYSLDFERANPRLQEIVQHKDRQRIEAFYKETLEKVEREGIKDEQVTLKINPRAYDVSAAIIGEAKSGEHGTVVIGRRGEREAFFTGRIAMRLVQKISGLALWVVP